MVNSEFTPGLGPGNLRLEQGNPHVEFIDRQSINVLLCHESQWRIRAKGGEVVIHAGMLTARGRSCQ